MTEIHGDKRNRFDHVLDIMLAFLVILIATMVPAALIYFGVRLLTS